jgi:hypothetical protein
MHKIKTEIKMYKRSLTKKMRYFKNASLSNFSLKRVKIFRTQQYGK